jgi:hypothetical protein
MPHGVINFSLPHGGNQFFFRLHGNILFSLAAMPHGGNQFLFRLHGDAPPHGDINFLFASWQRPIFLPPPHGDINFLFASRRRSIFLSPPHGKDRFFFCLLTAISIFYSPHSCANILVFCTSDCG